MVKKGVSVKPALGIKKKVIELPKKSNSTNKKINTKASTAASSMKNSTVKAKPNNSTT